MAELLCPVTCKLGCGNSSTRRQPAESAVQLRIPAVPAAFTNCSVATVAALLDEINEACCSNQDCSADGFKCTPNCGAAVIPAMEQCREAINYIFVDGDSRGAHEALDKNCLAIDVAPLVTTLDRLEQDGCMMDFEGVVALERHQHASNFCKDNDMVMQSFSGMTCKNVEANGQCMLIQRHVFPNVCKCSCPDPVPDAAAANARRQAQGLNALVDKSRCNIGSFEPKLRALGRTCCDPNDPDDKCTKDGMPLNCDYECAKELPKFFPARCWGLIYYG